VRGLAAGLENEIAFQGSVREGIRGIRGRHSGGKLEDVKDLDTLRRRGERNVPGSGHDKRGKQSGAKEESSAEKERFHG